MGDNCRGTLQFGDSYTKGEGIPPPKPMLTIDRMLDGHPNREGHRKIAKELNAKITQAIKEGRLDPESRYDFSRKLAASPPVSAAGLGQACRAQVPVELSYRMPDGQECKYTAHLLEVSQDLGEFDYTWGGGGRAHTELKLQLDQATVTRSNCGPVFTPTQKGPTVAKHKITSIADPLTKSTKVYVEVLKDGKSQEPEQYLAPITESTNDKLVLSGAKIDTVIREDGEEMPLYAQVPTEFATLLASSLQTV